MVSQVDICNLALKKLGDNAIISLDDNTEEAESLRLIYNLVLANELRIHNWRFAIKRTTLPALADAPAFGFGKQYSLPSDCLRPIQIGQYHIVENLKNYVSNDDTFYTIEDNKILTDEGAPLQFRYITSAKTPDQYDASFPMVLASRLAYEMAEDSTQSNSKRELAARDYKDALMAALVANAVEVPAKTQVDDSWIMARL